MARGGERVSEDRRSLHCRTCGAGNRLSSEARQHGWFQCAWCASPEPVPGVGDFAIQGPAGRVTRVVRPGSSEFETQGEFVLPLERGLLGVAAADLGVGGVLHWIGLSSPTLAVMLTPWLIGLLALIGVVILVGSSTRQRLAVSDGRVDLWWVTAGIAWRHRRLETERFHTSSIVRGRSGVRIRAPGGRLFVWMPGLESVRWLEREIVAAVKDARKSRSADRVACPGCGGPVAEEKDLLQQGAIECPHCQTGLVQTGGGLAMPPARIGHTLRVADGESAAVSRRDGDGDGDGDARVWTIPPWCHLHPLATPFNVLGALAIDATVIGFGAWAVWATPIFKVVAGGVALLLSVGTLIGTRSLFVWVFGRHTFRIDPRYLDHLVHIGPWRCRQHRIPFSRLVSLEAGQEVHRLEGEDFPNQQFRLVAEMAVTTVRMELYGLHVPPILRAVVEAIAARLEALGREVEGSDLLACPRDAARRSPLSR